MIDNVEIASLYEAGMTIREIAEKLNKSYEFIRVILKEQKVIWRKTYISDFTPEQIQNIISRYQNNETISKIAKWYNISPPAISRLLKANNIDVIYSGRKYDLLRETSINSIPNISVNLGLT